MRVPLPATLIAGLLFGGITVAGSTDPTQNGWQKLTVLDPIAARDIFAQSIDRESHLGKALALFTIEPRTKANLTEARQLLAALTHEDPDDNYGIAATYYLARLNEAHADKPDHHAAITTYRHLLVEHRGHPLAELAAPKLAILLLYEDVSPETWEKHYAEIDTLLPTLQTAAAQRDTRLVMADALFKLRQDHARAFPLLKFCEEADLVYRITRQSVLLQQLAESARVLGLIPEARQYYTRYLKEFPREAASEEIQRRLTALEVEATP